MVTSIKIQPSEYLERVQALTEYLQREHLTGAVLFDGYYILYYTGFAFIPTERPMAFVLNSRGEQGLMVPRLEAEHAAASFPGRVVHYVEYPYLQHPMKTLEKLMYDMGIEKRYGIDTDGYPWVLGYRGPTLSELTGGTSVRVSGFIEDQMTIKSPAEVALIRESVRWGNLAHTLLQRYTKPGITETEVSQRASHEATLAMLDAIGPVYQAQSWTDSGASAGYRGQIGRNAAIPHALAGNLTFRAGDVLVTGAGAPVWGYNSELERTMIIGPASDEQKKLFDHMVDLQNIAFQTIRPSATCAEVDRAVRAYFEQHQLMPYWKHHSGHAIGLRYHEGPFFDIGDATVIQPGMVFTVEPGLYSPALGGFRHSDTVLVNEDGIEVLTYYPRDLESLIIW